MTSMLKTGNFARYILTGTIGKVIDIKELDEKIWAQLDNGLCYDINYLEPISENEFREHKEKVERGEREASKMDEQLEKLLEKEEVKFEEELCGAG